MIIVIMINKRRDLAEAVARFAEFRGLPTNIERIRKAWVARVAIYIIHRSFHYIINIIICYLLFNTEINIGQSY